VHRHWRLNERMYGALQGLNKSETAAKHGEEQVKVAGLPWVRGFPRGFPWVWVSDGYGDCDESPWVCEDSMEIFEGI